MAWGVPSRERRVLKAGHSSIAVTLPKPWAEAMNLRPGDLIVFDQNDDGALYLRPAPVAGTAVAGAPYLVQAQSFDTPGVLERLIVGAYRVGHDAIEIRSETPLPPERVEELLSAARKLIGVSVAAQEPNRIVLQNFIDPSKYGLPQLVQRMKMILIAFLEESENLLDRRGHSKRLPSLDEETQRVLSLLVRQLFLASRDWSLARRIGSPDPRQLLEWRVVVHALQELGGLLSEMADLLDAGRERPAADTAALRAHLAELKVGLKAVVDTLVRPSLAEACEAYSQLNALGISAGESAEKMGVTARRTGIHAATIAAQRSAACLSTLAEVAVDRAVSVGNDAMVASPA
ncbi:MAG: AbrB/MazE/SpoVT family DNA-binding domain-containing protein [Thermoplasmata archaeon]|nr:AbrB/MazE/SpoVT family DNA-binding domain-containing protein [Thermoplasmata archaeon]